MSDVSRLAAHAASQPAPDDDVSRFGVHAASTPASDDTVSRFAVHVATFQPPPAIPPNLDAGVEVEAWDIENTTRRIASVPFTTGGLSFQQTRKPVGDGSITLPTDYDRIDEILDTTKNVDVIAQVIEADVFLHNGLNGTNDRGFTTTDQQTEDLLFAFARCHSGTSGRLTSITPVQSGWNNLGFVTDQGDLWWRRIDIADPTTWDFTFVTSNALACGIGYALIRGDNGDPVVAGNDSALPTFTNYYPGSDGALGDLYPVGGFESPRYLLFGGSSRGDEAASLGTPGDFLVSKEIGGGIPTVDDDLSMHIAAADTATELNLDGISGSFHNGTFVAVPGQSGVPLGTPPEITSGGDDVQVVDGYVYRQFQADGTLEVAQAGEVDVLIVGGGGGGAGANYGAWPGGGGGGGQVILQTGVQLSAGSYPVVVGAGGAGGVPGGGGGNPNGSPGSPGGVSSFNGTTAQPGQGGGSDSAVGSPSGTPVAGPPGSGYSGGGAVGDTSPDQTPGTGTQPGGDGGDGNSTGNFRAGGGGGHLDGYDGSDATNPGSGGIGLYVPEFLPYPDISVESAGGTQKGWFGGGGGGGSWGAGDTSYTHLGRQQGNGGEGSPSGTSGEKAVRNSGGGGGGSRSQQFGLAYSGETGADGVVIVRYLATSGVGGAYRSLLKVYVDNLFRYAFFPETRATPYGEDRPLTTISGRGQESQAYWAPLPLPDWNYGYGSEYFQNFTDPPEFLTNGGFTTPLEGSFGDPTPGWSAKGGADHTPCSGCTTGMFGNVIRVIPSGVHTGISQTIDVIGGTRYLFGTYIEGETTGKRITIQMNFNGEAASGATVHTSNTFVYPSGSDNVLAELENVARNPAGNGQPGGSTDGTVQYTELDVTVPAGCDKLTVSIQADHHSSSQTTFWVHGATLTGIGAGMPDEFDYEPGTYSPTKWDTSFAAVLSGDYAWAWTPEDVNLKRTLVGPIAAETGDEFFAQYAVKPPEAAARYRLVVYGNDATTIIADTGFVDADSGLQNATAWRYISTTFTGPGSGEVYLGIVIDGSTGGYGFDEVGVFSGRAPASPGKIISDMLTAVQGQGFLTWLTIDFGANQDSNGESWRSFSVAANFGHGGSLGAALDRMATMGYEWTIEAVNQRFGYDIGWVLRLFNGREA